jgi:hypothetical protein
MFNKTGISPAHAIKTDIKITDLLDVFGPEPVEAKVHTPKLSISSEFKSENTPSNTKNLKALVEESSKTDINKLLDSIPTNTENLL